jgi:superfamily II DNA or RNA helicase
MHALTSGTHVEHKTDPAFGRGVVVHSSMTAEYLRVHVEWTGKIGIQTHNSGELTAIRALPDRLAEVGPASMVPFQLKVLGRWFEAQHALTGELSNQPFQMLPHQVVVTNLVVNSPSNPRTGRAWLIADDVGLGKTIEAGMILEVLRKKKLGKFRCLIITPAGLMPQWQEELRTRFGRRFRIFDSKAPQDLEDEDQLLASIDTLKLKKFNDALHASSPWDVVIFDEAHHLATTTDVQTYKLAQYLRDQRKYLNVLFLSATPHSGNNEHFFNMLRLLREDLFPKMSKGADYERVSLADVVIRNRKSEVTDVSGKKIFKGIAPAKIITFTPTENEIQFYEKLRLYLKNGYKAADKLAKRKDGQNATAVGFLMSTFSKLASSSRAAIQASLQNRLNTLEGEVAPGPAPVNDSRFPGESALTATATAGLAAVGKGKARKAESLIENEVNEVRELVRDLEKVPIDTKLESFLEKIEVFETDLKLLIFTEFRATQSVLVERLILKFGPESVVVIHGSMDMKERRTNVTLFNESVPNPRFMVSSEAGGEGLNMQKSCHTVVNYDMPWNPMAIQQRIGRVYRYGQPHPVVVFNLKVESTSEAFADQKVYEYLEKKIDEVANKLRSVQGGDAEDLRGEVLGYLSGEASLSKVYKTAVEEGRAKAETAIDVKAKQLIADLSSPEVMGMFKGLRRFDITDYQKVAAQVDDAHLDFFVQKYLGHQGIEVTERDGLFEYRPSGMMVDIAKKTAEVSPNELLDALTTNAISRATVSKELARVTKGCRLMRFGDVAFETIIKHAQYGNFSQGVASIELPFSALEWNIGTEGTWVLFNLRVLRNDGSSGSAQILRDVLASFLVPFGGVPIVHDSVVKSLHLAFDGPATIDADEARRAYALAKASAEKILRALLGEVVAEYAGEHEKILPDAVTDVALAWVRAG